MNSPPRVFITYSHDSEEHRARVLALADRLRSEGIDASIDRYVPAPPEGWSRWMIGELKRADFILCICTDTYRARFEHGAAPGDSDDDDHGAALEGLLAAQVIHDARGHNARFIPVLLDGATLAQVPAILRPFTRYHLPRDDDALYRRLTGQHDTPSQPLGPRRVVSAGAQESAMAVDNPVYRWLHLSDLHVGCKGETVWWQMLDDFHRSLDIWLPKIGGPPDLLLLTGDLAWSGKANEYGRLDRFLERLLGVLEKQAGARPLLIPVAGNHDLQRPTGAGISAFRVLDAYESSPTDEDVAALRTQLWTKHRPGLLAKPFTHYSHWLDRTIIPQLTGKPGVTPHRSFFPGDLTVTLDLPDRFPLAIVGLNSAWSHYKGGDFTGKLLLPAEQFLAALPAPAPGGSPLDIFGQVERALLLMHHPRKWLTDKSRQIFDAQIHLGSRFTACLFGHMHEPDGVNVSQAGGAARSLYQAPSLFGLEHYGTKDESRIFGYTFGQLSRDGEVRLWPLRSERRGDGVCTFDRDTFFHWSNDELDTYSSAPPILSRRRPAAPRPPHRHRRSSSTSTPTAARSSIIPATSASTGSPAPRRLSPTRSSASTPACSRTPMTTGSDASLVDLADLLPKHHRLLIEGQPGSGKTTFLKLAASVLARDYLDEPCPDGPSWRAAHLGRGLPRTLPVFPQFLRPRTTYQGHPQGRRPPARPPRRRDGPPHRRHRDSPAPAAKPGTST
jgi:predicted phosphohydrolase